MALNLRISDSEGLLKIKIDELFKEYNDRLVKVVAPLVPSSALLDDILQEVWMRVYRYWPKFQGRSSVFTWLYRIAVNTTFTALKKVQRPSDQSVFDNLRSGSEPEKEYEKSMLRYDLAEAVKMLKSQQKEVFLLRGYQEMSFREIGTALSITENNARAVYFHAVRRLREKMKKYASTTVQGEVML